MVESRGSAAVPIPFVRRISWAAIIAGLAVALGIELLLSLLGIGIGASTIHAVSGESATASGLGIGSGIWFLMSTLIALFAGGWIAGRMAGMPRAIDGSLHGIIAWSLTTLATAYLLTTAVGGILGGATGLLGSALGAAGSGVAAVAPSAAQAAGSQLQKNGVNVDSVTTKIQTMLKQTGDPRLSPAALKAQAQHQGRVAKNAASKSALNPGETKQNLNALVYRFLHDTGATSKRADRQSLINVVAAQQHVSKAQATKTVDGYAQQAQAAQKQAQAAVAAAQQKAKEAADAAAAGVTKAAISAFFLLLLGAVAAAVGGFLSTRSLIAEAERTLPIATRTTVRTP